MDILVNQEEVKQIVQDHIEKRGHVVKSVDIFISFKDNPKDGPRKFHGKNQPIIDLEDLEDVRQSDLISFLEFQVVCKLDS